MNTPIEFRADSKRWKQTPTIYGWDSIILLEDTPSRIVLLGRDFGQDDEFQPWTNTQYLTLETLEDKNQFYEETANGNYFCIGVYNAA